MHVMARMKPQAPVTTIAVPPAFAGTATKPDVPTNVVPRLTVHVMVTPMLSAPASVARYLSAHHR